MTGFSFTASCPDCGGLLDHRCEARVSSTRTCAELWCERCFIVWRVDVGMTALDVFRFSDDRRERAALALGEDVLAVLG